MTSKILVRAKPLALALTLGAFATSAAGQRDRSPAEQAEYQARVALTESGKFLHNETPSPAMFKAAQALGLRADGIYWNNDAGSVDRTEHLRLGARREVYTDYLRFCPNGAVVGAVTDGLPADVKQWLSCEPVSPRYSHGVIKVEGETVQFTLHMTTGTIDYWGQLQRERDAAQPVIEFKVRSNITYAETYNVIQTERFDFHRWHRD